MSARFNTNLFAHPYAGKRALYGINDADILDNIVRRNVTAEFNDFDDDNVIRRLIRNNDFATANGVGRFNTLDNAYFGSRNNRLGLNRRAFDDYELARQARRLNVDAFDIDFDRQYRGPFNIRRNNILAQGLDPVEVEYILRRQAQRQANIGGGYLGGLGGLGGFGDFDDDDFNTYGNTLGRFGRKIGGGLTNRDIEDIIRLRRNNVFDLDGDAAGLFGTRRTRGGRGFGRGVGGFGQGGILGLSGVQDDDDLLDVIGGSRLNRLGGLGFNNIGGLGFNNRGNLFGNFDDDLQQQVILRALLNNRRGGLGLNNRGNVFGDFDDDLQQQAILRALLNNRRNGSFGNFDDDLQQQAILRALLNNRRNGGFNNFGNVNRVGRFNRFGNFDDDLLDDEVQQQVILRALLNNRRNGRFNNFGNVNRVGRFNRIGNLDDDLFNTTTGLNDFDIFNRGGRRFNNPRGNPFVDDDIQTERELHRGLRHLNRAAQATRAAGASVIRIADIMQDSTEAVQEKIMNLCNRQGCNDCDCSGCGLDFGGRW